ncbi:MAG: hypothetical protein ACR2QC_03395 [Gammaproteobacteria bacterium]
MESYRTAHSVTAFPDNRSVSVNRIKNNRRVAKRSAGVYPIQNLAEMAGNVNINISRDTELSRLAGRNKRLRLGFLRVRRNRSKRRREQNARKGKN